MCDPVVVIDDDPAAPNSVAGLARIMETIPYEVVALLGDRVARVTHHSPILAEEPVATNALEDSSLAGAAGLVDGAANGAADPMHDSSLVGLPVPSNGNSNSSGNGKRAAEPAVRKIFANTRN